MTGLDKKMYHRAGNAHSDRPHTANMSNFFDYSNYSKDPLDEDTPGETKEYEVLLEYPPDLERPVPGAARPRRDRKRGREHSVFVSIEDYTRMYTKAVHKAFWESVWNSKNKDEVEAWFPWVFPQLAASRLQWQLPRSFELESVDAAFDFLYGFDSPWELLQDSVYRYSMLFPFAKDFFLPRTHVTQLTACFTLLGSLQGPRDDTRRLMAQCMRMQSPDPVTVTALINAVSARIPTADPEAGADDVPSADTVQGTAHGADSAV